MAKRTVSKGKSSRTPIAREAQPRRKIRMIHVEEASLQGAVRRASEAIGVAVDDMLSSARMLDNLDVVSTDEHQRFTEAFHDQLSDRANRIRLVAMQVVDAGVRAAAQSARISQLADMYLAHQEGRES